MYLNDVGMKELMEIMFEHYHATRVCYNTVMYQKYINKYKLSDKFRFDGNDIVMVGEGEIEIGDGTYIGSYTRFSTDKDCVIRIGRNVAISHMVSIYTSNRVPEKYTEGKQSVKYGDVIVEDNCLLGVGSVILQGVEIGENCFIGANAVVTEDIPAYSVVAGVPAKIIKKIDY